MSRPKNIVEANKLLVDYFNRLQKKDISYNAAYSMMMNAYRDKKHWFRSEIGELIGECQLCQYKVLHGEEYVAFMDDGEVINHHLSCHLEVEGSSASKGVSQGVI